MTLDEVYEEVRAALALHALSGTSQFFKTFTLPSNKRLLVMESVTAPGKYVLRLAGCIEDWNFWYAGDNDLKQIIQSICST